MSLLVVKVLTAAGRTVEIDVNATLENGMFSGEPETRGEYIQAVRSNIVHGNAMLGPHDSYVLIERGQGIAYEVTSRR